MQQLVHRLWHRQRRYRRDSGFTIVELLVVLIVMAILAVIVITTYNGVQQKVRNTKTLAAAAAWVKAIHLYHADTGKWSAAGCLGEDYPSGFQGDSSAGQCGHGSTWENLVNPTLESQLRPYLGAGKLPTPDMQTIGNAGSWRRGIWYSRNVNNPYDIFVVQDHVTACPSLGGTDYDSAVAIGTGLFCRYLIQPAS